MKLDSIKITHLELLKLSRSHTHTHDYSNAEITLTLCENLISTKKY